MIKLDSRTVLLLLMPKYNVLIYELIFIIILVYLIIVLFFIIMF